MTYQHGELRKERAKLPQIHRGEVQSLADLQPLHDRVLVKRIPQPQGLIILTDREKARMCEVVRVGSRATWGYEPGQTVIVSPSINLDYPDLVEDGEQYVLVQQADILGIYETEEA